MLKHIPNPNNIKIIPCLSVGIDNFVFDKQYNSIMIHTINVEKITKYLQKKERAKKLEKLNNI